MHPDEEEDTERVLEKPKKIGKKKSETEILAKFLQDEAKEMNIRRSA